MIFVDLCCPVACSFQFHKPKVFIHSKHELASFAPSVFLNQGFHPQVQLRYSNLCQSCQMSTNANDQSKFNLKVASTFGKSEWFPWFPNPEPCLRIGRVEARLPPLSKNESQRKLVFQSRAKSFFHPTICWPRESKKALPTDDDDLSLQTFSPTKNLYTVLYIT